MGAQRTLLASASHELRSPLARIRMALELMGARPPGAARPHGRGDIAELDELIGELLLASRLQAVPQLDRRRRSTCSGWWRRRRARSAAEVEGEAVSVRGDARLLRRLVRNLLENARRHGAGSPVEASVRARGRPRARCASATAAPACPRRSASGSSTPFYRPAACAPARRGGGAGARLVRQIARRHGGEARCLAREGGGSCFEVELPMR